MRPESRSGSAELICFIAAFVTEDPAAAGASDGELVGAIRDMWPAFPVRHLGQAFRISATLREARLASRKTEEQSLIERTRLVHGARLAAELVYKYDLARDLAREQNPRGSI